MNRASITEETGSALITVLVMITVVTVGLGTVWAVTRVQHRFIQRDVHRLQARYAAESALQLALVRLRENPGWRVQNEPLALPDGQRGHVTVMPFGGFLQVHATASVQEQRVTLRALIGEQPPAGFSSAVVLGDTRSDLVLTGSTRIAGDVRIGAHRVEESSLRDLPYTGSISGRVLRDPNLTLPAFDTGIFDESTARYERYLRAPDTLLFPHDALRVHYVDGDLDLSTADALLLRTPLRLIVNGRLSLRGNLRFSPGSEFIAAESIRLAGDLRGKDAVFYGRREVLVTDSVRCTGQFIAGQYLYVTGEAYLGYPSVLYLGSAGLAPGEEGRIEVSEQAIVEGTLLVPARSCLGARAFRGVVVGPDARIRGGIYNACQTELHGTVFGSVLSHQFFLYRSPTRYINWIADALIDVRRRPEGYLIPPGFHPNPRFALLLQEDAF